MDAAEVKAAADRLTRWKVNEPRVYPDEYNEFRAAQDGDYVTLADAYLELEPLVRAAVVAWKNGHDHSVACALKLMREVVGDV